MALPDPEASRAILIGTAHYAPDSGFESFPEVERSLRDFAEFLCSETGLPEQHVEVILDPGDSQIIAARVTAAAQAATGLLLVYYVGHGVAVDNQLHLTHAGSRANEADVTALAYPVLRSRIKTNARGPVVVILDCCHSGRAFGRDVLAGDGEPLQEATDIDGAFVLTATDEKTKFARAKGEGGRTVFTGMMLDTLRAGVPTADRYLTMTVLFRELRDRLPAANMPKPKALERGTAGRVALAANAGWTGRIEPATLPHTGATPYTATIRDLTPEDGLLDRETELAELATFCDGDELYIWWQAGPWAGKTALMTWFALNPPPHTRVVSFFITSRMAAQDDHNAFTDALLEQLSALLPDQAAAVASPTANRDALRRHLLDLAAQRAADSGGRLVLLVDGLDEDRGQPSIASLLPKRPGPGLRVIVSGRPNPVLPLDVPTSHPLHHCRRREVDRSRAAFDIIQAARLELRGIIERSDIDQEVLGLITAAHGLTGSELEDLTGLPPFRISSILSGVTGRTFRAHSSRFAPDQINLLAHETLQDEAEAALGRVLLDGYRHRIHQWATRYRDRGWPAETPAYLLTRYFSMLRAQHELARMSELALDAARHDRLLLLTGSDGIARNEIGAVTGFWLEQGEPDLLAVCELAMRRNRLAQRGRDLPVELPAALARMGEEERATSLVDGMLQPGRRLRARIGVASVCMRPGEPLHNRSLVDALRDSDTPVLDDAGLSRLSVALVEAGDVEGAEALAREISTAPERVHALTHLIPAWRAAGDQAAVDVAMTEINRHVLLADPADLGEVTRHAIRAYAAAGDVERAESLGIEDGSAEVRVATHAAIARSMVAQGDSAAAAGHVRSALAATAGVVGLVTRAQLLASIAEDLTAAGFGDELRGPVDAVEAGLAGYSRSGAQPAVVDLVDCLLQLGEVDRAVALGRRYTDGAGLPAVLAGVLASLLAVNRMADARSLAAEIELRSYQTTDPHERDLVLCTVVRALATAGANDRALEVADRIDGMEGRFLAFTYLATHSAAAPDAASRFVELSVDAVHAMLARSAAGGRRTYWNVVHTVFATDWLGDTVASESHTPLAEVIRILVARGALDTARELAQHFVVLYSDGRRPLDGFAQGLGGVAAVFVQAGQIDAARELLDRITSVAGRLIVLRTLVEEIGMESATPIVAPLLDEIDSTVTPDDAFHMLPNRVNRALLAATLGDADGVARLSGGPAASGIGTQHVVSALATARARAGTIDAALAAAEGLTDDYARSIVYLEVVAAQVRAGQEPATVRQTADRIPLASARVRAIAQVVPTLAEKFGTPTAEAALAEATAMLWQIQRADVRDRSAGSVLDAALTIGAIDHAADIARATGDAARRGLFTRIADTLVRDLDDLPSAARESARLRIRRLLAETWGFAAWHSVLDTVARFDPELLAQIADASLRLDSLGRMKNQMNAL